jgi:hypothetical protein
VSERLRHVADDVGAHAEVVVSATLLRGIQPRAELDALFEQRQRTEPTHLSGAEIVQRVRTDFREIERGGHREGTVPELDRALSLPHEHRVPGRPAENPRLRLRVRQVLDELEGAAEEPIRFLRLGAVPGGLAGVPERGRRLDRLHVDQRLSGLGERPAVVPAGEKLGPSEPDLQRRALGVVRRHQS